MDTGIMSENNDFLQPLLEMMQRNAERQDKRLDELNVKIDANTKISEQALEQGRYTKSRVNQHDKEIQALQKRSNRKFNLPPPNVIYLVALGFVLLLVIIASILHVEVGGLLK